MIRPATIQWIGLLLSSNQILPVGCHCRDCEAFEFCRRERLKTAESGFCGYMGSQFVDLRRTHTARMLEAITAISTQYSVLSTSTDHVGGAR